MHDNYIIPYQINLTIELRTKNASLISSIATVFLKTF
jgi:hypothetical protein